MNGWLPGFLIALLPLLLLVSLLVHGCYPGERALHRLRRVFTLIFFPRPNRARVLPVFSLPPFCLRGGRLIADSLAGRGPPSA